MLIIGGAVSIIFDVALVFNAVAGALGWYGLSAAKGLSSV
jgi:hypothetical protein